MTDPAMDARRAAAIQYAYSMLHVPYIWGGDNPLQGLDCSGMAQEILCGVGMDPPGDQTAQALFDAFAPKIWGSPDPGCLVFFGANRSKIAHVGFVVAPGVMIEAGGGGSKTLSRKIALDQNARVRMRAVANRKDLVAICDPFAVLPFGVPTKN